MIKYKIRPAKVTDIPHLYRCELAYMRKFAPTHIDDRLKGIERYLETWTQNLSRCFVIDVGSDSESVNEFAGLALWIRDDENDGKAVLATVHVVEKFRRQGLARRLIETTIKDARQNEGLDMTLGVDRNNKGAAKLYEDIGFVYTREDETYIFYEFPRVQEIKS